MSQSAYNPLTQGIYTGEAPLFYKIDVTRLNMRPFAIAVRISYAMWTALKQYLVMPVAQLRKWSDVCDFANMWVAPVDKIHGRFGLDGTIVPLWNNRQAEEKGLMELRFDIRAHSAICPDLLHLYITMSVFFDALQKVIQDDADQELAQDAHVYPSKELDEKFDDKPATQLINIESLDHGGMKVALSPLFLNWLSDPSKHGNPKQRFDDARANMQRMVRHLGPMDGLCIGLGEKLDIGWKHLENNDRKWWLHFKGDEKRTCLSPRKTSAGEIDTRYGYKLINSEQEELYRRIDERRMVTNLIFLTTLIDLANTAIQPGAYLHRPGPFKNR